VMMSKIVNYSKIFSAICYSERDSVPGIIQALINIVSGMQFHSNFDCCNEQLA
jgi:hypothetical protein